MLSFPEASPILGSMDPLRFSAVEVSALSDSVVVSCCFAVSVVCSISEIDDTFQLIQVA